MEKKPRSARLSTPGRKLFSSWSARGVLAVVVAADRGAYPAEGRDADVRGDPQHRPGAVRGGAELAFEHVILGELPSWCRRWR